MQTVLAKLKKSCRLIFIAICYFFINFLIGLSLILFSNPDNKITIIIPYILIGFVVSIIAICLYLIIEKIK